MAPARSLGLPAPCFCPAPLGMTELRKLGFQLEGTLREYRNRRGVFGDAWFFGLLRREWTGGGAEAEG